MTKTYAHLSLVQQQILQLHPSKLGLSETDIQLIEDLVHEFSEPTLTKDNFGDLYYYPEQLAYIEQLLTIDLEALSKYPDLITKVVNSLLKYDLKIDPTIKYVPDRILTKKQQDVLDCCLGDIDVSPAVYTPLEAIGILTTRHVLQQSADQLNQFTLNEKYGGVPSFGPDSLKQIYRQLKEYGFIAPPHTQWVREQDVERYSAFDICKYDLNNLLK